MKIHQKDYPSISVIVPSFNQGRFLSDCLGSITAQLKPKDELFVLDGGSTDESLDVIKLFSDSITKWVSEPDGGQAAAVNRGISWSNADLIVWINSDDGLIPGALDVLRNAATDKSDLYIFDCAWIDMNCSEIHIQKFPVEIFTSDFYDGSMPFNQPSSVFSRKLFQELSGLDTSLHFALDFHFYARCFLYGKTFKRIPFPFAFNRVHKQSKTLSGNLEQELSKVSIELFGSKSRSYSRNILAKYGLSLFRRFETAYLLKLLSRKCFTRKTLPGVPLNHQMKSLQESFKNQGRK